MFFVYPHLSSITNVIHSFVLLITGDFYTAIHKGRPYRFRGGVNLHDRGGKSARFSVIGGGKSARIGGGKSAWITFFIQGLFTENKLSTGALC